MNFSQKIISAGLDEERPIQGISDSEIDSLEQSSSVKLPGAYKQFMRECGRSAGLYMRDAHFFFPAIKDLKNDLAEMIEEDGLDFKIPDNIFVFGGYQGYQYQYFVCDGNDDPGIYRIMNDGSGAQKISDSFTAYIDSSIAQYKNAFYQGNQNSL